VFNEKQAAETGALLLIGMLEAIKKNEGRS
jgi:hypothetical protein